MAGYALFFKWIVVASCMFFMTIANLAMAQGDFTNSEKEIETPTLCTTNEKVMFSCPFSNGKTVSICELQSEVEEKKFLQYRYGSTGAKLDFQYPNIREKDSEEENFVSTKILTGSASLAARTIKGNEYFPYKFFYSFISDNDEEKTFTINYTYIGYPGVQGANGVVASPGFGAFLDYLNDGVVRLKDGSSGHRDAVVSVIASQPDSYDQEDLLRFSRGYADTRATRHPQDAVFNGPKSALQSGELYHEILSSDTPLKGVILRTEKIGDFSPSMALAEPDVAIARAVFGSNTAAVKNALESIGDPASINPKSVVVSLGQIPGTMWVDPISGRVAFTFGKSGSGYLVSDDGFDAFESSSISKVNGHKNLKIGEGEVAVNFQVADIPYAFANAGKDMSYQAALSIQPSNTQISADGTTATLPNGQVIHAGAGGTLDVDTHGNLVVSRPAAGWSNVDGSAGDIRQITSYDAKGQQIGTVVAQNLPGQSALVENGEERSFTTTHADGTSTTVQTHFSAGTGWIDNQSGQTVLSLKDWQTQIDEHNAHLRPSPAADNDYQPTASNGESEARANLHADMPSAPSASFATEQPGKPADAEQSTADFQKALIDAFQNPPPTPTEKGIQLASSDASAVVSDAGSGSTPEVDTPGMHETASVRAAYQAAAQTNAYEAQMNNVAGALNLVNSLAHPTSPHFQ